MEQLWHFKLLLIFFRVLEEVSRRHSAELRDVQERTGIEKQAWEENYMKKQVCVCVCV